LVNAIFGTEEPDEKGRLKGGRLVVSESVISNSQTDIIQNRIKIDAFTGGTYPGALFDEMPVIGGTTEICLHISKPLDAEAALLLFLVRDLWEGILFIARESSIGRGYLTGIAVACDGKAAYTSSIPDKGNSHLMLNQISLTH
jgi:hypothetical protein